MSSSNRYKPVGGDDVPHDADEEIELAPVEAASQSDFNVKVLYKESSHTFSNLLPTSTVLDLKTAIETKFEVPPVRQRLIYAGKQLKPDDKQLSFFKIVDNASVHLFPIPIPTAVSVPVAGSDSSTHNPLQFTTATAMNEYHHSPIYFDPFVTQTTREVRLWCIILIFLSGMTLFNNVSYMTTTGRLGAGWLDALVSIVDTLCSAGGLYVGNLGMNSLRTMSLADIQMYVKALGTLGVISILMRVAWVLDVILQVKKAVDDSKNGTDTSGSGNNNNPSVPSDDPDSATTDGGKLNDSMVTTFAIQACIIALVIIMSWVSCYIRALRLQNAVQTFNNAIDPQPVQQV